MVVDLDLIFSNLGGYDMDRGISKTVKVKVGTSENYNSVTRVRKKDYKNVNHC